MRAYCGLFGGEHVGWDGTAAERAADSRETTPTTEQVWQVFVVKEEGARH